MNAALRFTLRTDSAEEGRKLLQDLCEKLQQEKLILDFHFEIDAPGGPVTEKCVLSGGGVIA